MDRVAARPRVHVFGLGPAGTDLVTVGTLEQARSLGWVALRTTRHPAASLFEGAPSFDHVYDAAQDIADVYPAIVESLVDAAREHGEVGYVVPGSPVVAEHTVELLVDDARVDTVLHPALSFLDLTWSRLRIDPVELGVRLVDGHRFEAEAVGQRGPMLVAQCDHRFVLSDIKLSVDDPPDVRVTLLARLGLPGERIIEVDWSDMDRAIEPDHLTSLWIPRLDTPVGGQFAQLDALMRRLRAEDPWKAEQSHDTLKRYLLEESYEVFEAIDAYDPATGEGATELCAELGDLLYQVVFHSAIASEAGWFTFGDVAGAIHDKLVRRHAHVAGPSTSEPTPEIAQLVHAWEHDKRAELGRDSMLDGIPSTMPALARALKVAKKADALGAPSVDAPSIAGSSFDASSLGELADRAVLGAVLSSLVDAAHRAGLDPEDALRVATERRIDVLRSLESAQREPPEDAST